MQTEQHTGRDRDPPRVPEHLKGTRQGIFHLLSQSAQAETGLSEPVRQAPFRLTSETAVLPGTALQGPGRLTTPEDRWQTVIQADNFIFSD